MAGRCELCSGKVVNGRCTECGMDYTRMKNRYRLNENCTDYDQKANQITTEYVTTLQGKEEKDRKTVKTTKTVVNGKASAKPNVPRNGKNPRNIGQKLFTVVILVILLCSMGGVLIEGIVDAVEEHFSGSSQTVWEEDSDLYYDEASSLPTMPEEGESLDFDLTQCGTYIVGIDIPEGTYVFTNTGEKYSVWFKIIDNENNIYTSASLDAGSFEEDVYLYTGACLQVSEGVPLNCMTDNAQVEDMEEWDGDEGEALTLPAEEENEMEYSIGSDIAPGRYTLRYRGEGTSVISVHAETEDYTQYISLSCALYSNGGDSYTGLVLEEGDTLVVERFGEDEAELELVPLTEAIGYAKEM